ncbi:MAG TPA: hypothetical protein VJ652_07885 [Noviherbaspirillum sp.]|nr:hypothetical protein [Noviherbaspirillum sp.]
MKVKHVFAALLLACSAGHSALAQEETASAAKADVAAAQAPAEQESKQADHGKSSRRSAHRTRKHAAKTASTEQASGTSDAAAEPALKADSAPAEKAESAQAAAPDKPAAQSAPVDKAPEPAAPPPAAASAAPPVAAIPARAVADSAPAPVTPAQPAWLDNFLFNIKATDVLLALFAGLLLLIARTQARRLEETAKAAAGTAQAAEKTARTAENALVAGQRAFMFLREFKTFLHLDDATGQYRWTLHPVWENSGNTPTKGLQIYSTYRLLDAPLAPGHDFASSEQDMVAAIAGPRALVEGAPGSIGAEELAAVQQGKKYFYIWGRAEYHDIFEGTGKHTTRFCNQLVQVIGDPGAPVSEHNMVQLMFGFHSENNGAD